MLLYYHPLYSDLILSERHRFPIQKYQLLKTEIENLGASAIHFQEPKKVTVSQLALCHTQHYIDELGLFNVSLDGVYKRDFHILNFCKQQQIPLMCALGGGYQRNLHELINVHKQLFKAAIDL